MKVVDIIESESIRFSQTKQKKLDYVYIQRDIEEKESTDNCNWFRLCGSPIALAFARKAKVVVSISTSAVKMMQGIDPSREQ